MAVTPTALIQAKYASTTATAEYTAATGRVIIDKFTAANASTGAVFLEVHIVPPSGSASAGNRVIVNRIIASGETYVSAELAGHVLENGSSLWCKASAANALVIYASGRVVA